jgi:hypothetical protein
VRHPRRSPPSPPTTVTTRSSSQTHPPAATPRDKRCAPSNAPTSSPRNIRQPPHRQPPGPAPRSRTGPRPGRSPRPDQARARAPTPTQRRSPRPPRGWGTRPSGTRGRGWDWLATAYRGGKPARAKASMTVSFPTPCSDVCTTRTARGASGRTSPDTASRYASSTSGPNVLPPVGHERHLRHRLHSRDPCRDERVGRRHDLRAVADDRPCTRCPAAGCDSRSP